MDCIAIVACMHIRMRLLHGGCGLTDRMADVASPRECNFIGRFRPAMANLVYVAVDGATVYSLLRCNNLQQYGGCNLTGVDCWRCMADVVWPSYAHTTSSDRWQVSSRYG
jgi:hypothetical protein